VEGRSGALAQGMEPSLTEKEEIGTLTAVTDRLSRGRGEEEMKPGGAEGIRELEANHCQCRSSPSQSRGGGGVHGGAGSRVLRGRAQLRGACIRGGEIVPTETNRTVSRGVCPGNGPDLCRTCLRRPCVSPSSLTPSRGERRTSSFEKSPGRFDSGPICGSIAFASRQQTGAMWTAATL